jgi:hypothetical protein
MDKLDKLLELAEKATPGPWEYEHPRQNHFVILGDSRDFVDGPECVSLTSPENAILIVEMRNSIKELCERVKAQEKTISLRNKHITRLKKKMDKMVPMDYLFEQ